jgi:hypothetical protein
VIVDASMPAMIRVGGNMLFWLRGRIEEIEKTEAWQKARANAHVRQTSASKALATKTAKAVTIAKNLLLTLKIERLSEETIVRRAEAYYRNKYWDFDGLTEKAVCSYVRHNLTNYNQILDTLKGKVGMGVLYEQVKLYLCTRIIRLYELDIDPEYAATGDPDANENDLSKLEELENRIFASLGTQGT